MRTLPLLLCAALAVSACGDRLGSGAGDVPGLGAGAVDTAGAAIPGSADDPTSVAHFRERVGDRVLFSVDQATLDDQARATLAAQAAWLRANPAYSAVLEGHADEQGTRQYNLALGARRAASARDYLVSQGIPDGRLRTISYGKERPLEVCSEESCYRQNRRVVTVLAAGAGV
jgi:peptidoglycan-associated lipoprotein